MATRAHLREQITSDKIGALTTVAFATVSVFQTGTTTPVTGTLFSTATGAGTLANPVTADANGVVEFWMTSPQVVDLSVVASGYDSATVTAQVIGTATGILNLNTTTTPTAAGDVQINGESFTYEGAASLHTVGTLDRAQTYTALQSFGTNLGGTLQTAAQPNITSVGVLAAPHMTSPVVDSGYSTFNGLRISGVDTFNTIYNGSHNLGITVESGSRIYVGSTSLARGGISVSGTTGDVAIGVDADTSSSAALEVASTTGALLIPRMTTTQRNALTAVNGMIVYDSTLNKFYGYENGAWATFSVL